jgi:hypothetical protein
VQFDSSGAKEIRRAEELMAERWRNIKTTILEPKDFVPKLKIDGATFWSPYEGLGCAGDLIKLMRCWVEADQVTVPDKSKAEAMRDLRELEQGAQAARVRVKAAMQEWNIVRSRRWRAPSPIYLGANDLQVLNNLQRQIEAIRTAIANSGGKALLTNLVIDYPSAEIRFSTESYFDFIRRSIDESLRLGFDGKLLGPREDQSW